MSTATFFKNFVKTPTSIGAVCPTSPFLSRKMTQNIDLRKAKSVVELGTGTGAITPHIINALDSDTKFFAVELNIEFYNFFRKKYPYLQIYNEDASNLTSLLKKENLESVDAVISALPWTTLSPNIQDNLLATITNSLNSKCYFITIAYVTGMITPSGIKFRKKLKKHFSHVGLSRLEWKNIPPAFVYRCRN
jgi:phosphatidylethanolamine/phosphatidyl-N-methylethanolamine N-methyltransferase